MTLLSVVSLPKRDEEGEYLEDHYFKSCWNATVFTMEHGIETFTQMRFGNDLADELAED